MRIRFLDELLDGHLWASIFGHRTTFSNFTRLERAGCCFLLLELIMVGALFFTDLGENKPLGPFFSYYLLFRGTVVSQLFEGTTVSTLLKQSMYCNKFNVF